MTFNLILYFHDNNKYIKAKINLYNGKKNTDFQNNKIEEEGVHYSCLSVMLLDSVLKVGKKYYLQTLLEVCKYVVSKYVRKKKSP